MARMDLLLLLLLIQQRSQKKNKHEHRLLYVLYCAVRSQEGRQLRRIL